MTWQGSVMSPSHRIKGETTDEAFQEQCFLWERGASVAADFKLLRLFTVHDKDPKTHNGSPSNLTSILQTLSHWQANVEMSRIISALYLRYQGRFSRGEGSDENFNMKCGTLFFTNVKKIRLNPSLYPDNFRTVPKRCCFFNHWSLTLIL